ncbi:uncharacterized protein [Littorina saxatilis]|uniref:Galaxin-like repeats domain-containing protein n=1 Tax=Littorina saxatilis TaxID=31220 RepID=A0AAN9BH61_9CAEN
MTQSGLLQTCVVVVFLVVACHCVPGFNAWPLFTGSPANAPQIRKKCGEGKEQVQYSPDLKSCCRGHLHNIPENTHAQCCGEVAYWRNETKPERCTVPCGSGRRHPETEICCNGRVEWVGPKTKVKRCCGTTVIEPKTHDCCGGSTPFPSGSDYKCCGHLDVVTSALYNNVTMDCDATSGNVSLKPAQRFRGQELCDLGLTEWDTDRSLPNIVNRSHHHIRGWAEKCMTNITRRRSRTIISISMTPFFTTTPTPSKCADSKTVHVMIKVKNCNVSVDDLQDYLHGVTLDIFFKNNFRCKRGVPTLRLKDKYNAAMLLSKHSNAILARSLGYDTRLSNQWNHS